jgi:hypothetical protein
MPTALSDAILSLAAGRKVTVNQELNKSKTTTEKISGSINSVNRGINPLFDAGW